jgi:hypothetical protein
LLGWVEPFGRYDDLSPHAVSFQVADVKVWSIGLDDLIAIKRHISRGKDRAALVQLEAIRDAKARGQV